MRAPELLLLLAVILVNWQVLKENVGNIKFVLKSFTVEQEILLKITFCTSTYKFTKIIASDQVA